MPYKKVVVPLDGSKLSEIVLPHLEQIASGCHISEIALVTVTEETSAVKVEPRVIETTVPFSYDGYVYRNSKLVMRVPVRLGKMAKAGRDYLLKIASQLEKKGLTATTNVLIGNVAEQVVRFAHEENADLIIMASQGKTAFRTWDVGKTAIKVFRASNIPVLLVKPPPGFKETKPRRKGEAGDAIP